MSNRKYILTFLFVLFLLFMLLMVIIMYFNKVYIISDVLNEDITSYNYDYLSIYYDTKDNYEEYKTEDADIIDEFVTKLKNVSLKKYFGEIKYNNDSPLYIIYLRKKHTVSSLKMEIYDDIITIRLHKDGKTIIRDERVKIVSGEISNAYLNGLIEMSMSL